MTFRKYTFIITTLAVIATIIALFLIKKQYPITIIEIPKYYHPVSEIPFQDSKFIIPDSLLLSAPFTPQAPTGNWDILHNENCEEASSLMAMAYYITNYRNVQKLDPIFVESELTKLTDWELKTFGYNLDITSEETAKMIEANYGLNTKILYNYSENDIKKELTENRLILFPANGQMLNNPNYKQPGPIYHMVLIRGFNETEFITNDPGTRKGMNYNYPFTALYKSNGNWSHKNNKVDLTQKNIIVVWK